MASEDIMDFYHCGVCDSYLQASTGVWMDRGTFAANFPDEDYTTSICHESCAREYARSSIPESGRERHEEKLLKNVREFHKRMGL